MKNYKLAIFDWDGTLLDSTSQIINNVLTVADFFSVECPDSDVIRKRIGIKTDQAFDLLFPSVSKNEKNLMVNLFFELSKRNNAPLYSGAKKLIQNLKEKNYYLAIATNRYSESLCNDLKHHKIDKYFDQISCATDDIYKPHPVLISSVLKTLKISAHDAVMIGDSFNDVLLAKNSGVDSVVVSNELQDKDFFNSFILQGYFESIGELESWFLTTEV